MKTTDNIKRNNRRRARRNNGAMLLMSLALVCALAMGGLFALGNVTMNRAASAEAGEAPVSVPTADNSPAIYVAQKNANSVVGIITPGASGMQPRDPCRPWRGTSASGHKPR